MDIYALVDAPTIVKVELNIGRGNSRFGIVVGELLPKRFLFCKKGYQMDNNGYIKLYRSMIDWEWYSDINTQAVFIYLLLNANWEDSRYRGHLIPKGSLVTGRKVIAETLGMSEQNVRTSLEHLKSTNEITIKSTNKFSVVTITNWEKFQCLESESTNKLTNELTNNQPTTNQQLTTYKEIKNIRIEEDNNIYSKKFTPPSLDDVRQYCQERNNNVDPETFISFYESKGWMVGKNKMKDWKASVRTWERGERKESPPRRFDANKGLAKGNYDFDMLERETKNRGLKGDAI